MAQSDVRVVLTANADQMRKTIDRQQKQLGNLRKRNTALATSNKKLGSSFGNLAGSISPVSLGLAGVAVGGLRVINNFRRQYDEIGKLSKSYGIGVETLQRWDHTAKLSGTTLTAFAKGAKNLSGVILDANDGMVSYQRAFEHLGLSWIDLTRLTPEEQMNAVADALSRVEDKSKRTALAQDLLGRAGVGLLAAFGEQEGTLKKTNEELADNAILTQDQIQNVENFNDALVNMSADLKGEVFEAVTLVSGAVKDFIDFIEDTSPIQLDFIINTEERGNGIFNALTGNALPMAFKGVEAILKNTPDEILGFLAGGDGQATLDRLRAGSGLGAAGGLLAGGAPTAMRSGGAPSIGEVRRYENAYADPNAGSLSFTQQSENDARIRALAVEEEARDAYAAALADTSRGPTGPDLTARSDRAYDNAFEQATTRAFREAIRAEDFSLATETADAIHSFSILGTRQLETEGEIFAAIQDANFDLADALYEIDDAISRQLEAEERAAAEQLKAEEQNAAKQESLTQQLIDESKAQTQLLASQGDDFLTQALLAGPAGEKFKQDLALIQLGSLRGRGIASRDFETGAITEERFSSILDSIARREEEAISGTQQFYASDTGNLFTFASAPELFVTIKSDDKPDRRVRAEAGPVQGRPRGACG